jgi:hypothetical protein
MSYFVFEKNSDNIEATLYRIAENQFDLDNLNIIQSSYKIIEDLQNNFDLVKYGDKQIVKYNNNTITYIDQIILIEDKKGLQGYINNFKNQIKEFTSNNPNHPLFNRWNDYYNQLSTLNLDSITYPLNKSLEQYFNDLGQPSYNILQLP